MENIKLIVAYDGTRYRGWQKVKGGFGIEDFLQKAIEQVFQHPVQLQAASRTDAGVHAQGQVVNFLTTKENLNLSRIAMSLNRLLPKDIKILKIETVSEDFHPTLSAKGKEYHYQVCYDTIQLPQNRFYSWHYHYPLDLELIQKAAILLNGSHNFSSFCNLKKTNRYTDFEREITEIIVQPIEFKRLHIIIKGNSFLYKMVRNMVGTLIYAGRGKIGLEELPTIIAAQDRKRAGISAPAHGLSLHQIFY